MSIYSPVVRRDTELAAAAGAELGIRGPIDVDRQMRTNLPDVGRTSRILGVQLLGHLSSEIAKRIDIPATAIHNRMTMDAISDLDLSYTPPLGSSWDALQHSAQAWQRVLHLDRP